MDEVIYICDVHMIDGTRVFITDTRRRDRVAVDYRELIDPSRPIELHVAS